LLGDEQAAAMAHRVTQAFYFHGEGFFPFRPSPEARENSPFGRIDEGDGTFVSAQNGLDLKRPGECGNRRSFLKEQV
jgi:hypothetical protein